MAPIRKKRDEKARRADKAAGLANIWRENAFGELISGHEHFRVRADAEGGVVDVAVDLERRERGRARARVALGHESAKQLEEEQQIAWVLFAVERAHRREEQVAAARRPLVSALGWAEHWDEPHR